MKRKDMFMNEVILVEEAMGKACGLSIPPRFEALDLDAVLEYLRVFRKQKISVLVKHLKEEETGTFLIETAKLVLAMCKDLGEKTYQLSWNDTQDKVATDLSNSFPELFQAVNAEIEEADAYEEIRYNMNKSHARQLKSITALLSTPQEVLEIKQEIGRKSREMQHLIDNSKLSIENKEKLNTYRKTQYEETLLRINVKLEEEPVKVLYYRSGTGVSVKVKLSNTGYSYREGRGKEVRRNKGADKEEYPLIISLSYIEDFLSGNGVANEDVLVDKQSLDTFYQFGTKLSANLTPKFVEDWYNYDCPDLYRLSSNKEQGLSWIGEPLPHFCTKLVEVSWSSTYVNEGVSEEEVNKLTKGREHTGIATELTTMLKSKAMRLTGEADALEQEINEYDEKIQKVIHEHASTILEGVAKAFPERMIHFSKQPVDFKINDDFGLDCGYINIRSKDDVYTEKRKMLSNVFSDVADWMSISLPLYSQSTTLNKVQFDVAAQVVRNELGIELFAHTVMD